MDHKPETLFLQKDTEQFPTDTGSTLVFNTKPYDRQYLEAANREHGLQLHFTETKLDADSAVLAAGHRAVCAFVNDDMGSPTIERLADNRVRLIALRSAGFNNVDLAAAKRRGITIVRVPDYSPFAIAEHCVGLILSLNRKLHRAHNRVHENNYSLDGLLGFDLHGKTVGIIGTGKIGTQFAEIMNGFGVKILAVDPSPNDRCIELGVKYTSTELLFKNSDIVSLHCPLTSDTKHLIDQRSLELMREGVMLINTSRGGLIDTDAVITSLKNGRIGHLGLDVYEEEADLFFEDLSEQLLLDDVFSRLLTFPNVLITGHQAFFTHEALESIAQTTVNNLSAFFDGRAINQV